MLILTERTPNPDAMKFVPDLPLTDGPATAFTRDGFDPDRSELARHLFALEDVAAVLIARTFVTVSRRPTGRPWSALRFDAIRVIADHLGRGAAAIAPEHGGDATAQAATADDEIAAEIRTVLELWVRPGLARDGGDILFEGFDATTGVLRIRMQGACGGCPSARLTLKAGVEQIVRRYVPEVLTVEAAEAEATPREWRLTSWLARRPPPTGSPRRPIFTNRGREVSMQRAVPTTAGRP